MFKTAYVILTEEQLDKLSDYIPSYEEYNWYIEMNVQ